MRLALRYFGRHSAQACRGMSIAMPFCPSGLRAGALRGRIHRKETEMISKQTRKSQMPRNWSFLLALIVVATFLESRSFPFTTTVADAQSEQSIERASPPVESVEATAILAPLPEEVTELRQVVAKSNGRDSAPVEIHSKIQNPDKNIVRHFEDVLVTTPDFTFKAEAALQGN